MTGPGNLLSDPTVKLIKLTNIVLVFYLNVLMLNTVQISPIDILIKINYFHGILNIPIFVNTHLRLKSKLP